jgi:hypothetical protein
MIPEFSVDTVTVEQQVIVTFFQEALKLLEASELV